MDPTDFGIPQEKTTIPHLLHPTSHKLENHWLFPTISMYKFPLGMSRSEKKQTSYKVLMGLIILMFALQTIHNICDWYQTWLGFIYYSNAPDQALDALEENSQASHSIYIITSMENLLTTLRLAIADSIMVSTHLLLPANTTNLQLQGLEVLDHMQQQLENSNCPSDLKSRIYRYMMPFDGK
jgi:hypothetical protein